MKESSDILKVPEHIKMYFEATKYGYCYQCKICPNVQKKKSGTSWANLISHLNDKHPDWKEQLKKVKNGGTLDAWVDMDGINSYRWLDWIISENLPFSIVEKETTRSIVSLKKISAKKLKECLHIITRKVENIISDMLPDKFAVIFDGWRAGDTHFVALFATFMYEGARKQILLCFSPLLDETSQDAVEHVEFIKKSLQLYGKNLQNVCCFIGDNCQSDRKFS